MCACMSSSTNFIYICMFPQDMQMYIIQIQILNWKRIEKILGMLNVEHVSYHLFFFSLQGLCLCISSIFKCKGWEHKGAKWWWKKYNKNKFYQNKITLTSSSSMDHSESMYLFNSVSRNFQAQLGRERENDAVHVISNNIDFCFSY